MVELDIERDERPLFGFPVTGDESEILRFLLKFAVLAPSSHNSQPWRFRVSDGVVELWADRSRLLVVADPRGRELTISCGAALTCLQVAARHFGYTGETELLPDPTQPDLLARLRLGVPRVPTEDDQRLFQALPRRRTHRAPFADRPVSPMLAKRLRTAAAEEGVAFESIERVGREALAELVAEGDRRQGGDRQYRHELAEWVHGEGAERRDGIPLEAYGFEGLLAYFGPLMLAHVNWGSVQAKRDQQAVLDAPLLGLLVTPTDEPADWLATGAALARLLLIAAAEGVYAGYLNQPVQIEALRGQLVESLGLMGFPQLVIRLGHGEPPAATPRRPVADVLDTPPADLPG